MHRRLPLALAATAVMVLAAVAMGAGLIDPPGASDPTPSRAAAASGSAPTTEPSLAPTATPAPPTPSPRPPLATREPYIATGIDVEGVTERLQTALDLGRVELVAPGIQASVIFPDGRIWTGVAGVADLATGRALAPDTPFAIASVSKTFVAAAVLALVGEGRLGLDDPVAPLLPGTLVGAAPIDPLITVRMLLDHTSGLRDYLISQTLDQAVRAEPTVVWTPAMALAHAGTPLAPPGRGYHYANTNYVLLGLIVEGLTGRTLAAELRARFFDPLRLGTVSYQGFEAPTAQLPTTYRYSSLQPSARPQDITDGTDIRPFTALTTATGAAGSIAASTRDLVRWARALYGGYVLPRELLTTMVRDADRTRDLDPGYPYGLGTQVFLVDGRVSYGHSGRLVGARTVLRWFPDSDVAIAITTNQSRFDPTPTLVEMLAIVAPRGEPGGLTPR